MKDILTLARQAGFTVESDGLVWFGDEQRYHCTRELQAFAALVRNAALEEAADTFNRFDLSGLKEHPDLQKLVADSLMAARGLIIALKESGK